MAVVMVVTEVVSKVTKREVPRTKTQCRAVGQSGRWGKRRRRREKRGRGLTRWSAEQASVEDLQQKILGILGGNKVLDHLHRGGPKGKGLPDQSNAGRRRWR